MSRNRAPQGDRRGGPLDPRLLREVAAARQYVIWTALFGLVSAALVVAQALVVAGAVARLVSEGHSPGLPRTLLTIAVLALLQAGAHYAQEVTAGRAAARTIATLRKRLITQIVARGPRALSGTTNKTFSDPISHSSPLEHLAAKRAEIATLATRGLDALEPYLTRYLPALLLSALVTPTLLVIVGVIDWVSLLICLVTVPLIPIFMWLIGKMAAGTSERRLLVVQKLGAQMLDIISGLPTLRAFGREGGLGARVRALGDSARKASMSTLRIAFLSSLALELLTTISVAMVAVGVGLRLAEGQMTLAAGLAVIMLAPEVFLPLRQVGAQFHASNDGVAAINATFDLLASSTPPATLAPESRTSGGLVSNRPDRIPSAVVFRDVSVRSGERDGWAPAHLNARIPLCGEQRGVITALVGPSGVGKSTTALLLLGLLQPDSGQVLVEFSDGSTTPLNQLPLQDWWSLIAWIPQRPAIEPGQLADVIGLGQDSATRNNAAKLTGFDAVIDSLPGGWNTTVGVGGVGLSVGQRQRAALTAMTLAGPAKPIIVLDEPTAHLDAAAERAILDTMRAWRAAGRAVIVIAHRKTVVDIADQIIPITSASALTSDAFAVAR